MFRLQRSFAVLVLLVWAAGAPAATGVLDLIPADGTCAFAIRNVADLKKKGEKFLEESKLNVGMKPSEMLQQVYEHLGVAGAVDEDAPAVLLIPAPKKVDGVGDYESWVAVVPFKDRDAIGEKFGLKKGELKEGVGTSVTKGGQVGYVFARGKHVFLGPQKKAVEWVVKQKSLRTTLSEARAKALDNADILVNLAISDWPDIGKPDPDYIVGETGAKTDAEKKMARQMAEALGSVKAVLLAARVGDGLGIDAVTTFTKDAKAARALLATLRSGKGASDLKGLPTGKVLAAHAARNDGTENALVAKLFFNWFLRAELETHRLLSAADRPLVTAVFTELWKQLQGRRLAVYQNAEETKHGLFSTVLILDTKDPKKMLAEIKDLARFAEGKDLDLTDKTGKAEDVKAVKQLIRDLGDDSFPVRDSATTRLALIGEPALPLLEKATDSDDAEVARRARELVSDIQDRATSRRKELLDKTAARPVHPGFVLDPGAETLDGQKIDIVHVKLAKEDASAVKQLRQLLGPDWHKVRLAVVGKQVVVLVGSDVALLKQAVKNLKDDSPGLAADKTLAEFNKYSHTGRKFELHVGLAALETLISTDVPDLGKIKAGTLSSLAIAVEEDRVELNVWLPMADLKAMVKQRGW